MTKSISKLRIYLVGILVFCSIFTCSCCSIEASKEKNLLTLQYDTELPHKQIVFIFPGKGESTTNAQYLTIGEYYKLKGITPVYVNIDWGKVNFKNLYLVAEQTYRKSSELFPNSHIYIFGFSFGAVIGYKFSELVKPEQTILCSMSPLFEEDRKYLILPFQIFTKIIFYNSKTVMSYAENNERSYVLLYGDHDSIVFNDSIIKQRQELFKHNKTIIVKNARHDISGAAYLGTIKNIILGDQ